MNIEILKNFITMNNNDVEHSLKLFMDKPETITNYNYIHDTTLYLNDNVILIKKNTLKIDIQGVVVNIGNKVCIKKRGSKACIFINPNEYYIFSKKTKNKNNDRMFYQELLKVM
jgi:hypothetical protein